MRGHLVSEFQQNCVDCKCPSLTGPRTAGKPISHHSWVWAKGAKGIRQYHHGPYPQFLLAGVLAIDEPLQQGRRRGHHM